MSLCIYYVFLICLWPQVDLVLSDVIRYPASILEDADLTTLGLLRKYGYQGELHSVATKDGFQLGMHRIPKPGAQPVLLVHGMQASSSSYLLIGPCCALGYLLSDRGYDVWMLNFRGNLYSRKHRKYHPVMWQFWNFSFHENGIYDIPAAIDYVLAHSRNYTQLHYIGYSQSTTSIFVTASEKPEYMKKIKLLQAMAPVAYFDSITAPLLTFIRPHGRFLMKLLHTIGIHELPPERKVYSRLMYQLCSLAFRNTCTYYMMLLSGMDYAQLNPSLMPILTKQITAGSSVKTVDHYAQLLERGGFFKFDYGNPQENLRRYGQTTPPDYKLGNVNCKVALYYGRNDFLTNYTDVQRLRDKLPNVVHDELLSYKDFNHMDFLIAKDSRKLIYDSMLRVMEQVDKGEL